MADEQSVEERVENLFAGDVEDDNTEDENAVVEGDDVSEEEASEEEVSDDEVSEDNEEETAEVEYDGVVYEVPIALKDALLRESDYTTKTQELSSERKSVEVAAGQYKNVKSQQEFGQAIQNELLEVYQAQQSVKQYKDYLRSNVDELSNADIIKINMEIDRLQELQQNTSNSLAAKWQEHQQAAEQSLRELREKSTEVLKAKIHGWDNKAEQSLRDYALSLNIPEQAYENIIDPLEKEILYKAMQFDALQSRKADAVKKVVGTPSIKAKSRNPMPEDVKRKLNTRKQLKNSKLSDRAKARIIQDEMAERFG